MSSEHSLSGGLFNRLTFFELFPYFGIRHVLITVLQRQYNLLNRGCMPPHRC
ncbi:hypothetical protein M440DRAFT_362971 [Trichoderma longibrachiatum ATCC 18648]|uniref:Uncharacterized protein n=1 Tax=Trichoderma longibrachiatum ATCC 18648 TaxID=983965 RepID=A0A2T4C1S1_TRILO|nr:hypothetical protein M440DRAFT_362971 [Trichoderma longibrachiatum ATCC 18648]